MTSVFYFNLILTRSRSSHNIRYLLYIRGPYEGGAERPLLTCQLIMYLLDEVLDRVLEGLGRLLRLRHVRRGDPQRPRRAHEIEGLRVHTGLFKMQHID